MMESIDDDIFILNNQDTLDGSFGDSTVRLKPQDFIISRAGTGVRPDPAVHALQQAYTNLKKRYNETVQKNQQITRVLRDVRELKGPDSDMASYGDGEDSYSASAQGAAATGEHVCQSDNFRAQQGYVRYLEREKVSLEAKLHQMASVRNSVDSMQTKLRETVSSLQRKENDLQSAQETIQDLKTENMRLREDRSEYYRHATDLQEHFQESLQSSVEKQSRGYDELQQKFQNAASELLQVREECDRLKVSESLAKEELQSTKSKLAEYEQRYETLQEAYTALKEQMRTSETDVESSMPTTREMDYLKKVIADLRKTVIQQREFLGNLGKPASITNARSDAVPVFSRQEDVGLGQSWETVPKFLPASPQSTAQLDHRLPLRRTRASDGAIDASPYADHHSRSEILRRKPSRSTSPRSKSEVIVKAVDMPRNTLNYHPDLKSPVLVVSGSNMNGGSAGYQSVYDNMSSTPRRITPEVVADFGDVTDDTPAFPVFPGLHEGSSVDRYHPVADRTGRQEASRGQPVEEKICPVCSRDFSAMLIEDFQTHVFECFDDHSAPETLRPSNQNERICPMCNKLYPESVSQEEFEKHVQIHFEENITDRFEILEP